MNASVVKKTDKNKDKIEKMLTRIQSLEEQVDGEAQEYYQEKSSSSTSELTEEILSGEGEPPQDGAALQANTDKLLKQPTTDGEPTKVKKQKTKAPKEKLET